MRMPVLNVCLMIKRFMGLNVTGALRQHKIRQWRGPSRTIWALLGGVVRTIISTYIGICTVERDLR